MASGLVPNMQTTRFGNRDRPVITRTLRTRPPSGKTLPRIELRTQVIGGCWTVLAVHQSQNPPREVATAVAILSCSALLASVFCKANSLVIGVIYGNPHVVRTHFHSVALKLTQCCHSDNPTSSEPCLALRKVQSMAARMRKPRATAADARTPSTRESKGSLTRCGAPVAMWPRPLSVRVMTLNRRELSIGAKL